MNVENVHPTSTAAATGAGACTLATHGSNGRCCANEAVLSDALHAVRAARLRHLDELDLHRRHAFAQKIPKLIMSLAANLFDRGIDAMLDLGSGHTPAATRRGGWHRASEQMYASTG